MPETVITEFRWCDHPLMFRDQAVFLDRGDMHGRAGRAGLAGRAGAGVVDLLSAHQLAERTAIVRCQALQSQPAADNRRPIRHPTCINVAAVLFQQHLCHIDAVRGARVRGPGREKPARPGARRCGRLRRRRRAPRCSSRLPSIAATPLCRKTRTPSASMTWSSVSGPGAMVSSSDPAMSRWTMRRPDLCGTPGLVVKERIASIAGAVKVSTVRLLGS